MSNPQGGAPKPPVGKGPKGPSGGTPAARQKRKPNPPQPRVNPHAPAVANELRRVSQLAESNRATFEKVAGAIIDPGTYDPVRMSIAAGRKTFTNRLKLVETSTVPAVITGEMPLVANAAFFVARRDPRCAGIKYEIKTSGQSRTYKMQFENGSLTSPGPGPSTPFAPSKMVWSAGWKPHGDNQYVWRDSEGVIRVWVENQVVTNQVVITITGLAASTPYNIVQSTYFAGVEKQDILGGTSDAGGVLVLNGIPARAGYTAWWCNADLSGQPAIGFEVANASVWCARHLPAPQFDNNLPDIDALRVNSLSLLYSDRTAELYAQGNICAYQCAGGEDWGVHLGMDSPILVAGHDPYATVATYNDSCKGPYKKGRYIFSKLGGLEKDLAMMNMGDGSASSKVPPPIDMNLESDYLYIGFNAGSGAAQAPIGEWTVFMHVEGETESQWKATANPQIHPRVLIDAQFAVSQCSQDFENAKHVKGLWGFLRRLGSGIADAAEIIVPALNPSAAPLTHAFARGGRRLLQI